MKAQKKFLFSLVGVLAALFLFVFLRDGSFSNKLFETPIQTKLIEAVESADQSVQEKLGEVVSKNQEQGMSAEEIKNFWGIISDMQDCVDVRGQPISEDTPIGFEPLMQSLQSELGPGTQADLWMNWHLRWKDGSEKRLRLEIIESDEGKAIRELHLFAVDKEGLPIPIELPAEKSINVTDEVISQMLKEGDVYYKEKAGVLLFPTGDRLEYVEKNGILSELEFIRGDKIYKCTNLKSKESCQCIR
ncbi:MAG: hypothetical protein BroJett040_03930 [Oligoflexia bacterium]|nr:MAG: hypothetical protein BroJett040_03930 [Oligoflexia bacterium]